MALFGGKFGLLVMQELAMLMDWEYRPFTHGPTGKKSPGEYIACCPFGLRNLQRDCDLRNLLYWWANFVRWEIRKVRQKNKMLSKPRPLKWPIRCELYFHMFHSIRISLVITAYPRCWKDLLSLKSFFYHLLSSTIKRTTGVTVE